MRSFSSLFVASVLGCSAVPAATGVSQTPADATSTAAGPAVLGWPGVDVARAYPVGKVRVFAFEQGGELTGRSWGRYMGAVDGEPGHHRFETKIELLLPGRGPLRSEGELVLDAAGDLVRGFERSDAAQLHFVRKGDVVEFTDGSRSDEVGYATRDTDVAVMAHSALLHEELFLRMRAVAEGTMRLRLLSISGGPPTEWEADVEVPDARRHAAKLRTNLGENIAFVDGWIEEIFVQASDLRIVTAWDTAWPIWQITGPRTMTYVQPPGSTFTTREVELAGRPEEPALAGEVTLPAGPGGPYPGIVWIGGTGREDRYGFAGPPPVDLGAHEITDALANAGFVVLRFDERGRGGSDYGDLSFLGQVEDARRAVRTLLVQPEVDSDRLIVVGLGEGGWRAMYAAKSAGTGLVGVALLGVPGRRYEDVFREQAERALKKLPPQLRDDARTQQAAMLEAIEGAGDLPPELSTQGNWIREIFAVDPSRLVAAVGAPILIAQGGKDFEVDPRRDVDALVKSARAAKRLYRVTRYPNLDHLFKFEPGESAPERYLVDDRHVDEAFLHDLVDWARSVAAAKPQPAR